MTKAPTIDGNLKFTRKFKGAKRVAKSGASHKPPVLGHIPRISKLMALAFHCDGLIRTGHLKDCTEIAVLFRVYRARTPRTPIALADAPLMLSRIELRDRDRLVCA